MHNLEMPCNYAKQTGKDCGCKSKIPLVSCRNIKRTSALSDRFDGARWNTTLEEGVYLVRAPFCTRDDCFDYEEMTKCAYATFTNRRWINGAGECVVVECRSPRAKGALKCFKDENGVEYPAVRRPCDENYKLIADADYLHVRSRFCNAEWCPYFEREKNNDEE